MKKVVGGKDKVCPVCGDMMVYLDVKGIGTVSQCKKCGLVIEGRMKDEVVVYSYDPIKDNGDCKIKSNKSKDLRQYLNLDFGRGKKFSYKVIADNVVNVYKKGLSFYITKNQLEEYFNII